MVSWDGETPTGGGEGWPRFWSGRAGLSLAAEKRGSQPAHTRLLHPVRFSRARVRMPWTSRAAGMSSFWVGPPQSAGRPPFRRIRP